MNIRNLLIHIILILAGAIESAIGLLQIYGLMDSNHGRYVVTGTFLNPGPYSGFLAMTLPVCLHCYLKKQGGMKYVAATVGAMILCVLPAGMSRTAWIAAAMGMLWAYGAHRKWPERVRLWAKQHRLKAMGCVLGVVGALLLGGWMLFILKPDSAKGRLFMWRIESRIVIEHPSGVGCGRFAKAYGEEQEKYFSQGEYEEWEVKVAGSPEYAFNEYLQLAIEHGVGALVALFVVMGLCVWRAMRKGAHGMAGALVALALFAFASYPMEYALFRAAALLIAVGCLAEEGWKGWMITIAGVIGAVYLYCRTKRRKRLKKHGSRQGCFIRQRLMKRQKRLTRAFIPN
ncbi:MAG: O-antigen ligase family protein [Mediterranea massiliensis]|nr:O-antigen ligase family protein [Mediterranea massiliensis]